MASRQLTNNTIQVVIESRKTNKADEANGVETDEGVGLKAI